ncbi:hypothetical protein LTR56_000371 [Elasticomyces elasticus]|nr:hypothetical protein LTR56_000371 [Elasticomyces elasticus]KAK3666934.1 hypothetical protein LTR22_002159 [Elasticomyces elasticus]KAK4933364.1 hypothetical protein LTR49_000358 [Elasticomyces elasticus]KAK5755544.1 hypothetical protein LTS12_014412 [Elasticomyces elasticus]
MATKPWPSTGDVQTACQFIHQNYSNLARLPDRHGFERLHRKLLPPRSDLNLTNRDSKRFAKEMISRFRYSIICRHLADNPTTLRKAYYLELAEALFTIPKKEMEAFGAFLDRPARLAGCASGGQDGYFASKPSIQLPALGDVLCLLPQHQLGDECINKMLTQLTEHDCSAAVGSMGYGIDVYSSKISAGDAVKKCLTHKPNARLILLPLHVVYGSGPPNHWVLLIAERIGESGD